MILPAQTIRKLSLEKKLIDPFNERGHINGMTYGLGPCTYDLRIAQDLLILPTWHLPRLVFYRLTDMVRSLLRRPRRNDHVRCGFALASTMERVKLPADLCGMVLDKSSNARRGIAVQNTEFDPGFEGYPTIEVTNHGMQAVMFAKGTPICQFKFARLEEETEMPYRGRYQGQGPAPVPFLSASGTWD